MNHRKRAPKRRILPRLLLLSSIIALLIVFLGPRVQELVSGPPDFSGEGSSSVQIEVAPGDSIAKIGNVLKAAGVVKSVDAFTTAAAQNPDSKKIAPGFYEMRLQMGAAEAIKRLLDPQSKIVFKVTVPEGKRASDIYVLISAATGIALADLISVATDPVLLPLPEYANGNVEGFLYPATYEFPPGVTALETLTTMVAKFNAVAKQIDLIGLANSAGVTPYEALIIASLLEGEGQPADFPKISRVVYNRLSEPMPLQFDSSVNYGLDKTDVILTTKLLNTPTPYNTYLNRGLPPTPISNPGLAALEASTNPAPGDWLFFVTVNFETNETKFTSSYSEFLKFKDELLAYCKENSETCYK